MTFPGAGGGAGAIGSMKDPHVGQNCSSAATVAPQLLQVWDTTALLRRYCATGMGVLAVRTYEPWTVASFLTGLALAVLIVVVLIFALQRGNR
jgi:predicted membrane protein